MFSRLSIRRRRNDTSIRSQRQDKLAAEYGASDARTIFAELLRRVQAGEVVVISRYGTPIAKLIPYGDDFRLLPGMIRASVIVDQAPLAAEADPIPTRSSPEA
jgi:prevent-host-death family protein